MKMNVTKKLSFFFLCMMLIMAMAFVTTGCENVNHETNDQEASQESNDPGKLTVLGEGTYSFLFDVIDKDGNETNFEIHTDKTIVGEALQDLNLIEGAVGDYGLYVTVVNGITADYSVDGTYWAFYIDGEYAMTGVDTTDIVEGSSYAFKVEK